MADVRMTRHIVHRIDDLLRLTDSSDLEELATEASWWADPSGPEFIDLYEQDHDDTSIGVNVGWHYEYIEFPVTLAQFWRFVEKCYVVKKRNTRLLQLPD